MRSLDFQEGAIYRLLMSTGDNLLNGVVVDTSIRSNTVTVLADFGIERQEIRVNCDHIVWAIQTGSVV